MAFDPENHTFDPATGFQVHKDTGHVIGVQQAPVPAPVGVNTWPRWVTPHDSYIVRRPVAGYPDDVTVSGWPHYHVGRDGAVTVLVANEDEEKRVMAEYQAASSDAAPVGVADEAILRSVRSDVERIRREQALAWAQEQAEAQAKLEREEVARRVAEKTEREARERQAAIDLEAAQRARINETLGGPVVVPSPSTQQPFGNIQQAAQPQPSLNPASLNPANPTPTSIDPARSLNPAEVRPDYPPPVQPSRPIAPKR